MQKQTIIFITIPPLTFSYSRMSSLLPMTVGFLDGNLDVDALRSVSLFLRSTDGGSLISEMRRNLSLSMEREES